MVDKVGYSIDGTASIKVGVHKGDMDQNGDRKIYSPIYCSQCHCRIEPTKETNEFGESTIHFYCPRHGEIMYLYDWDFG